MSLASDDCFEEQEARVGSWDGSLHALTGYHSCSWSSKRIRIGDALHFTGPWLHIRGTQVSSRLHEGKASGYEWYKSIPR